MFWNMLYPVVIKGFQINLKNKGKSTVLSWVFKTVKAPVLQLEA